MIIVIFDGDPRAREKRVRERLVIRVEFFKKSYRGVIMLSDKVRRSVTSLKDVEARRGWREKGCTPKKQIAKINSYSGSKVVYL